MKSKVLKIIALIVVIGMAYFAYLWFMPHRNIQKTEAYVTISATDLVNEFLSDAQRANDLYLDAQGESKVIIVSGTVERIEKDQLGQRVVLLKDSSEKMGVSCTFALETNEETNLLEIGNTIKVKGVIRSGAEYDEELDLVENVILEKCAVIQ